MSYKCWDNGRYRTHLIILDADGMVVWFDSDGFSVEAGSELMKRLFSGIMEVNSSGSKAEGR